MAREESGNYPSSAGQLESGRQLVDELQEIGLADARQNEFGIVTATVPATRDGGRRRDRAQFAPRHFARNDGGRTCGRK